MQTIRLGDLLVQHGVLTPYQRDLVLGAQRDRGGAFGALAEEMFGVSPTAVEQAWAAQYATIAPVVDPRTYPVDTRAIGAITRRQAWQFRVLPLEFDGTALVACTTQQHLVRALRFTGWRLGNGCHFVLSDPRHLGEAMMKHYPMAGMTPGVVMEAA